jgi:hypothetical protein
VAYYSQFEDPGAEGGEPAEGGQPPESGEPGEGGSPASEPEETILSASAEPEAEAVPSDLVEAGPPVPEEPSAAASEALEVVSGEGPETVEQFGTIEDAGSPHNHAEGAGAESVPKTSSEE